MTTRTSLERRFLIAFLVLLGSGTAFNLVWESRLPSSQVAVRRAADDDLLSFAYAETSGLPGKVGFALGLHSVASGGVLVVPEESTVERRQVEALANMTLRVESYDPLLRVSAIETLSSFNRIEGHGKLHFLAEESVRYVIIWDTNRGPVEVLRLFRTPTDTIAVIDDRLAEELVK